MSETHVPVPFILATLLGYSLQQNGAQPGAGGPPHWPVDLFVEVQTPYEILLTALENIFYGNEPPFNGQNRRSVAKAIVYVCQKWFDTSLRSGGIEFGGEENAVAVAETLQAVVAAGVLDQRGLEGARVLLGKVEQALR